MTAYSVFQVAGLSFPLPAGGDLYASDPVLAYSLAYWKWLIETYCGDFITAQAGTCNVPMPAVVQQVFPDDPIPYLLEQQLQLPCLAAYRKDSTFRRKTAGWEHDRCTFDLLYILPPLHASQATKLLPIRRPIAALLREKTTQSFDPAYTPRGGALGDSPFAVPYASVEEVGFTADHYSAVPGTANLVFPMLHMEGYFVERDMYVPGPKFAGGDVTTNLEVQDGTSVPNFIQTATQLAPTLTGVSPNTGTSAGGTSVTLTGTLFLKNPQVYFGGVLATNIVWVSATSITCRTPAVSGAGAVPVTVANIDGQTVTVNGAFTYT